MSNEGDVDDARVRLLTSYGKNDSEDDVGDAWLRCITSDDDESDEESSYLCQVDEEHKDTGDYIVFSKREETEVLLNQKRTIYAAIQDQLYKKLQPLMELCDQAILKETLAVEEEVKRNTPTHEAITLSRTVTRSHSLIPNHSAKSVAGAVSPVKSKFDFSGAFSSLIDKASPTIST